MTWGRAGFERTSDRLRVNLLAKPAPTTDNWQLNIKIRMELNNNT
ncbi:hypothetical protein [Scytonema millei]|nr:hypothetical protein [Scytonema millei]